MSQMLYCIEHERMFHAEEGIVFGHEIIICPSADESPELEFCEFEGGWATCPPPEYDLEGYIQEHGQPPSILSEELEEVYPFWVFDPHTEHMVMEERVQ